MRVLLFSLILALTHGQSYCQTSIIYKNQWIQVGVSSTGDITYIRKDFTSPNTIWTLTRMKTWKSKNKVYKDVELKELIQFDCNGNQIKPKATVYYSSNGAVLKSIQHEDYLTDWQDIVPETVGEPMLNLICKLKNNQE